MFQNNFKNFVIIILVFVYLLFLKFLFNINVFNFKQNNIFYKTTNFQNYSTFRLIKNIDDQLKILAKNFNKNNNNDTFNLPGPKMKSINEILRVTDVLLEPTKPCNGNFGQNQMLLVLLYIKGNDIKQRNLIRQTYGSDLNNDSKSKLYFLIAQNNNKK